MILSNALLVIETILFLVSGRLHGDESLSQRFSYYIGGWEDLYTFLGSLWHLLWDMT